MSLVSKINALAQAIAADIKALTVQKADVSPTVQLPKQSASPAAITDKVTVFGRLLAGRVLPTAMPERGSEVPIGAALWRRSFGFMRPYNGGTPWQSFGFAGVGVVGTGTGRAVTATNTMTRAVRSGVVSAASAGSLAGMYSFTNFLAAGDGQGVGGYLYQTRFAFSDAATVDGARAFVGLQANISAPANVEPNTLLNCLGVAQLSGDSSQLYLVYGGTAAQNAIPLGANFPPMQSTGVAGGTLYDLILYAPPGENGSVYVRIERVGTQYAVEYVLTPTTPGVQTPANTTFLSPRWWRSNNASPLAVGLDVCGFYYEVES